MVIKRRNKFQKKELTFDDQSRLDFIESFKNKKKKVKQKKNLSKIDKRKRRKEKIKKTLENINKI